MKQIDIEDDDKQLLGIQKGYDMICLYGITFNIIIIEAKYKYYVYLLYKSINRDFDNIGTETGIKV